MPCRTISVTPCCVHLSNYLIKCMPFSQLSFAILQMHSGVWSHVPLAYWLLLARCTASLSHWDVCYSIFCYTQELQTCLTRNGIIFTRQLKGLLWNIYNSVVVLVNLQPSPISTHPPSSLQFMSAKAYTLWHDGASRLMDLLSTCIFNIHTLRTTYKKERLRVFWNGYCHIGQKIVAHCFWMKSENVLARKRASYSYEWVNNGVSDEESVVEKRLRWQLECNDDDPTDPH